MKDKLTYSPLDFVVLLISLAYIVLTAIIWPTLSIGYFVLGLLLFVVVISIYLAKKKRVITPLIVAVLSYLIFIEIYFFLFRINLPSAGPLTTNIAEVNWGSAFIALIIVILTPFFIALNGVILLVDINRDKKKSKNNPRRHALKYRVE